MAQIFDASVNPTLPEVAINIGGAERPMSFSYAAIAVVEAKYGEGMGVLLGRMDQLRVAVDLLHAALSPHDKTLTPAQVGPWVNIFNLKSIQDAVLTAWLGSMPEGEAEGEDKAQVESES
jgi:hypothetical protein